ncbi:hypothetical protein ACQPYV_22875 [Micromonospora saelicesensis]|uniref:hypothetical protein n=1 Tax=Micromonospora saelicesensis TaxID=285676 RepID=UPI003D9415C2
MVTVLRAGQQLHVVIYLEYGRSATARGRRSPIRLRAAADTLRRRRSALGLARRRARTLGLSGAAFPWRTIRGEECSAFWPAGAAALHLNAVVARTVDL